MPRLYECLLAVALISSLLASPARSQQAIATPATPYPDTAGGLQRCLTDVLAAAEHGDSDKVAALLKDMEIPNFPKWFNKTYGKQLGKDSAEIYRMNVDYDEVKLGAILMQFTKQNGQVVTRRINDAPQPGTLEPAMLQASKIPTEIYSASWHKADTGDQPTDVPIGYFVFIAGNFRWDTAINYAARRVTANTTAPKPSAR